MLNEQQLALVQAPKGKILCVAGAGSGKTFSIVRKIEYAITHQGIKPNEILAVTFTKKAATEMLERIYKLLGMDAQGMFIGTLNSFCHKQILKDLKSFGFLSEKRPQIFTKGYKTILRGMFPKSSAVSIDILAGAIERHLTKHIPFPNDEDITIGQFNKISLKRLLEEIRKVQFDNQLITFTDQIVFMFERLERDLPFRKKIGSDYKLIIVDEAQDNNYMQNRILLWLSEVHNNILAVGDDAQSIYNFRGAEPDFFLDLHKKYDFDLCTLTTNYRSYQSILDVGNASLQYNFNAGVQIEKKLVSSRETPRNLGKPKFVIFNDQSREMEYIISEIQKYNGDFSDIAILCRSVLGNVGRLIQPLLRSHHIPYRVVGGRDIIDSPHVKRMFSAFALACGHSYTEDWVELLKLLPGIGEVKSRSIAQDIPNWNVEKIPESAKEGVEDLIDLISRMSEQVSKPRICYILFYSWYMDICQNEKKITAEDLRSIDFILNIIGEFLDTVTDLEEAVDLLKLDEGKRENEETKDKDKNAVTISNIHRAKGLEWPFVIMPDCNNDVYPHKRSHEDQNDLYEECRVFHVGVTRAKNKLLLTASCDDESISPYIDTKFVDMVNTFCDDDNVKPIRKLYTQNGATW